MPLVEQRDQGTRLFAKYFSICQVSKTPRDGFEPIQVDNPQTEETVTKYIKRYDKIIGYITKIEWRDTEDRYEQQFLSWNISMDDGEGMQVTLTLDFNSAPSHRFMCLAENIDFKKMVEISAWRDTSGKAPKIAFNVRQDGQTVVQKYKKDNLGDCPAMVKTLGKWNSDDQMLWLHGRMVNMVIPIVDAANAGREFGKDARETEPVDDWDETPEAAF